MPVRGQRSEINCQFNFYQNSRRLSRTFKRPTAATLIYAGNYVQIMTKATPAMVMKWMNLARKLAPDYPSMNKGYPAARMRVYAAIAERYGVQPRTVARYLSPATRTRAYSREYQRLKRHLDTALPQLFNGRPELSLTELSGGIETHAGIKMQAVTLEKLLARYEGKPRGPPAIKTESGYRLNPAYYSSAAYQPTPSQPVSP